MVRTNRLFTHSQTCRRPSKAWEQLRRSDGISDLAFRNIIGFERIKKEAAALARHDIDILIQGETGVGKGLLAQAIHILSPRKEQMFCHIDCASLPSSLFESELFGYKRGAFTDAKDNRIGKIEEANKGTAFLDEIGEIPLDCQAKLLRVIEHKCICPLGENVPRPVDVRFIFATNGDLHKKVANDRFRGDLFYRICNHTINIPPLRLMKREIPKITLFYWEKWNKEHNYGIEPPNKEEIDSLLNHEYPGNIRELVGILERIYIAAQHLDRHKRSHIFSEEIRKLKYKKNFVTLKTKTKEYIEDVVDETQSICEAARILDIDRKTLRKKLAV
jgi:transcriptional regulator with PAS, ATPase and Fis domain